MLRDACVERVSGKKLRTLEENKPGSWNDQVKKTALAADRAVTLYGLNLSGRFEGEFYAAAMAPAEMFNQQTSGNRHWRCAQILKGISRRESRGGFETRPYTKCRNS
jgi:hypothetical protein